MVETYESLCRLSAREPEKSAKASLWEIGDAVFTSEPLLYPDTRPVLESLNPLYTLVLATKGDREIQEQRILTSSLHR